MKYKDGVLIGWRLIEGEIFLPHYFEFIEGKEAVSLCGKVFSVVEDLVFPNPKSNDLCITCKNKAHELTKV